MHSETTIRIDPRRNIMKLIPLQDWVVIVPSPSEVRTAGGLYIPDTAKQKPDEGVVEAAGPGAYEEEKAGKKKEEGKERKFVATTVKPGDRVLYERWAAQTYRVGNEELVLVRESNILGLLDRPLEIPASTTGGSTTQMIERPPAPVVKGAEEKSLPTKSSKPQTVNSKKAGKKK